MTCRGKWPGRRRHRAISPVVSTEAENHWRTVHAISGRMGPACRFHEGNILRGKIRGVKSGHAARNRCRGIDSLLPYDGVRAGRRGAAPCTLPIVRRRCDFFGACRWGNLLAFADGRLFECQSLDEEVVALKAKGSPRSQISM